MLTCIIGGGCESEHINEDLHLNHNGELWDVFGTESVYIESVLYMGQVMELWLSCYLVLLSIDSKTR